MLKFDPYPACMYDVCCMKDIEIQRDLIRVVMSMSAGHVVKTSVAVHHQQLRIDSYSDTVNTSDGRQD